jgi:hypothetical protein
MKISDRFTDYGLIGGFFWILQLVLCLVVGRTEWADHLHKFTATLNGVPASAFPPFVALLGALGLIAVFTTGLLLDLLGSSYFLGMVEMMVFVRHAREHIHWFQRVADLNKAYIQEDCSLLLNVPPYRSQFAFLKVFKVWNKRDRESYLQLLRRVLKFRRAYTRMQSFLLSYVLLTSGVEKLELLSTQMSLWNTGRAIATAILISAIEVGLAWVLLHGREGLGVLQGTILVPLLTCQLLLSILGFIVAQGAYERVCSTLFALVYVISERELRGATSVSPVPPAVLAPAPIAPAPDKQAAGE